MNKALHFVGIPAMVIAILGLLSNLSIQLVSEPPLMQPSLAWIALLGGVVWTVRFDRRLAVAVAVGGLFSYAIGVFLPIWAQVVLFVAGLAMHFIGHFLFEGKAPRTARNPESVLAAPVWLLATWAGMYKDSARVA
jgi:uncharacterized membrane protein YGL010W